MHALHAVGVEVGYAVVGAPSEGLQFLGIVAVPCKWCAREQEYVVLLSADGVVANQLVELLYVGDHHVTFRTVDGALVAVDVYGMTCSVLVAQLLEHVEYGAHLFVAAREFRADKTGEEDGERRFAREVANLVVLIGAITERRT